jgi:hypothetical protein
MANVPITISVPEDYGDIVQTITAQDLADLTALKNSRLSHKKLWQTDIAPFKAEHPDCQIEFVAADQVTLVDTDCGWAMTLDAISAGLPVPECRNAQPMARWSSAPELLLPEGGLE